MNTSERVALSEDGRFLGSAPLVVMALLLVDSLHYVFARLLRPYLPAATSAFFVLGVAAVETAVFLTARRQIRWVVFRQHAWFFLSVGLMVALSTALSYAAVSYIDPGTASLLGQTTTLFALLLGWLWLHEKMSRGEWLGALVALLGVFIISFQPGDYLRLGSLLVLVGSATYALHAAFVKRWGEDIDFGNFFFFRVGSTAVFLLLFNVGGGTLTWPKGTVWLFLLLAGTVDVVISRVLYYLALRRLRMSFHAILLTLSPAITVLWSLMLFGERPSLQGLVGGTAVLMGVIIVTRSKQQVKSRKGALPEA